MRHLIQPELNKVHIKTLLLALSFIPFTTMASLSPEPTQPPNYDESQVPDFQLPDPLVRSDGRRVETASEWPARRQELLQLLKRHQYGFAPNSEVMAAAITLSEHADFLDGAATLKQVELQISHGGKDLRIGLLIVLPNNVTQPFPAFLGLNFFGNHTTHADQRIVLHDNWVAENPDLGIRGNRATGESRGVRAHRWPMETIIESGHALITAYCGDIDPDFDDGFGNGVHALFSDGDFSVPAEERWGTVAAWAWGLSRIFDYISEGESAIDSKRVNVIGHSRLGKAALWAAANDTRFAAAISNNSGCSGAALHRRAFGERIHHINTNFPHWLNGRAKDYSVNEEDLPIDQHQLLAVIAPRPVYVASAADDLWADPQGEFLSLKGAESVYRLFGIQSLLPAKFPAGPAGFSGPLGYHLRSGGHDLLAADWARFIDFSKSWVR